MIGGQTDMTHTGDKKSEVYNKYGVAHAHVNINDIFTKEEILQSCIENDLPHNFYEMSVKERRDAILASHRRRCPLDIANLQ